jgi:hypothetical protein
MLPHFLYNWLTDDRLPALRAGRSRKIPGTHFCQKFSLPTVIVLLKGLGQLQTPMALFGTEPVNFRLVA